MVLEEALVSAFLRVAAVAVPDDAEVVETVAVARDSAEAAGDDTEAADIAGDDTQVVEAADNNIGAVDVVAETGAVASVRNPPACKTRPGNATVATAAD